jgi:hypothetical protein
MVSDQQLKLQTMRTSKEKDQKSIETKIFKVLEENGVKFRGESLAISIAMAMQRTLPDGPHPGLHLKPLDAAIGRVTALYCPGSRHG